MLPALRQDVYQLMADAGKTQRKEPGRPFMELRAGCLADGGVAVRARAWRHGACGSGEGKD
jgi:hypothetical protein